MILDLREVFSEKKKSIQVEQQIDMSDFEQAGIHPIEKPVRFEGMVKNTAGIVKLIGTAYYEYRIVKYAKSSFCLCRKINMSRCVYKGYLGIV